jgi:hypothetical protein
MYGANIRRTPRELCSGRRRFGGVPAAPPGLECTPCPAPSACMALCAHGSLRHTSFSPPGHPRYATQKAAPLSEQAAKGQIMHPGPHSNCPGHDPSLEADSDQAQRNTRPCRPGGPDPGRRACQLPRAREEAIARPWPQDGKRWCWRATWEAGSYITGPIPPPVYPLHSSKSGQSDARSLEGRVRERGRCTLRLPSTARVTLGRAGHCTRGPGTRRTKERTRGLPVGVSVRNPRDSVAERHPGDRRGVPQESDGTRHITIRARVLKDPYLLPTQAVSKGRAPAAGRAGRSGQTLGPNSPPSRPGT